MARRIYPYGRRLLAVVCVVLALSTGSLLGIAPSVAATGRAESTLETALAPSMEPPPVDAGPLRYRGAWSGFHVADVTLTLRADEQVYWGDMDISTRGLLGWAFDWMGELHARGTVSDETGLRPTAYERRFSQSDETGAVVVEYDATGVAHGFEDGKPQRDVDPALRQNTIDPLAALIALRHHVQSGRLGMVTMPIYDGKRRMDVVATIDTPRTSRINRRDVQVIPVVADITPVAGFKAKQARGWSNSRLRVMFSADDQAVPLQIFVESPVGTAVLTLR